MQYTIRPGDTLYRIAQRATGDGDRWSELYGHDLNWNRLRSGTPELIYPGEIIELPPGWSPSPGRAEPPHTGET